MFSNKWIFFHQIEKIQLELVSDNELKIVMLLWRNRVARPAVDRTAGGSSPSRSVVFLSKFLFHQYINLKNFYSTYIHVHDDAVDCIGDPTTYPLRHILIHCFLIVENVCNPTLQSQILRHWNRKYYRNNSMCECCAIWTISMITAFPC